ncbi:molybdopterin-guanine dinucleotide biosynthesis protein B [Magnetovirga frankeli]|uniref:molybdopterin-guanine dinucleotide biosynthesis protein B n=1 Tax=Magnetovirga frankeli TaxID=947516 RepID=UPI001293941A|nr:molybdopterin-guanine dinucleotide biosynthesis protein B [gamma proteobacterium SS-5]
MPDPAKVLGFAAFSGVGKTSLLKRLIPLLRQQGLRIGLIKLSHHHFEVDVPGKDSYELRQAGAEQVLLCSPRRWALITELEQPVEPDLERMLVQLDRAALDLVLVEGFRHAPFSKIELHRPSLGHPLLYPQDPNIIAIASDVPLSKPASSAEPARPDIPQLGLNQPQQILAFILHWMRTEQTLDVEPDGGEP